MYWVDSYHTPVEIKDAAVKTFESYGYTVGINSPFSGSIVPLDYYNKDKRVSSMMIEINRGVYLKDGIEINREGMQKIISACNQVINTIDTNFDTDCK